MKILFIIILFSCTGPLFCQSDSLACNKFKKGNFVYVNEEGQEVNVQRKSKSQKEYNLQTGVITRFRLKWTSACTYEITQVWSDSKKARKLNGSTTVIEMISPGENSYIFRCACKGLESTKQGIMIRKT